MKITFPMMGNSYLAFKTFVQDLGHEVVVPPKPSKRTLSLGTQYAPEFACIPFKILLGTYLEALEKGADTIITSGGIGPCRAGYYGVVQQKILRSLGYNPRMIVFEPPRQNILDFLGKIRSVIKPAGVSWRAFWRKLKTGWTKLKAIDESEFRMHQVRPYEIEKGRTTKVYRQCLKMLGETRTLEEIEEAKQESFRLLDQVPQDKGRCPIKIGIIGEIYVVLEPFANFDIEDTLEKMGVYTDRSIYLTDWSRDNIFVDGEKDVRKTAQPYLNELIGGHGVISIGRTVMYAKQKFDGVVQLAPFTCIPEIVAKSILPQVSRDLNIPVMTIFIDEQTGKAGMQTRLEAFIDLLQRKKEKMEEQLA